MTKSPGGGVFGYRIEKDFFRVLNTQIVDKTTGGDYGDRDKENRRNSKDDVANENGKKESETINGDECGPIYDLCDGTWICRSFFLA